MQEKKEAKETKETSVVNPTTVWKFITAIIFLFSTAIVWLEKQNLSSKDKTIDVLENDKKTIQIQLDSSLARREHEASTYLNYFITEVRNNGEESRQLYDTLRKGQIQIMKKR